MRGTQKGRRRGGGLSGEGGGGGEGDKEEEEGKKKKEKEEEEEEEEEELAHRCRVDHSKLQGWFERLRKVVAERQEKEDLAAQIGGNLIPSAVRTGDRGAQG